VPGVQWGFGAVGNALWKGARLKDVLSRANVRPETIEVALNGADGPVLDGTPDFIKSIPLDKALDENTLIAYEMNGALLPHYNGFPVRLILPGWTATYRMKHLVSIEAVTKPFAGWVHVAKVAFEKYFLHKVRAGTTEPYYEKMVMRLLDIGKIKPPAA
jgi:sulfite dehydrogenase